VIVGGTGKVAVELTRLLLARNPRPTITSIIRSTTSPSFKSLEALPNYSSDNLKAVPLSLETSTVQEFSTIFKEAKADVIVFSAGAGGKAGDVSVAERTKKVDYEGAVKVFDAIEHVQTYDLNPRLILVSAVDARDENIIPDHYNEADKNASARIRAALSTFYHYKYLADKDLVGRTKFKWTILKPGGLSDKPAVGLVEVGRTHITEHISRADVAHALEILVDRPDAAGLALDVVGGNTPIYEAFDKAIKDRVTSWVG